MPSRYEPCGLSQIYSLKYGTVPIVRATGGLDDTVQNFDPATGQGTGFKFEKYSGQALLDCVREALEVYVGHGRVADDSSQRDGEGFSWKTAAAAYVTLYEAAKRARIPRVIGTSGEIALKGPF